MPQHYPKSTLEVSALCSVCSRSTMHRVDDGHQGPCLACLARLNAEHDARPLPDPRQKKLFE